MPRIYTPQALSPGHKLQLDAAAARHVQVLRMQPGDTLILFNGQGGEFEAKVTLMGRSQVEAEIGAHHAIEREAARQVHLAIGMPANERMDWLIEKATELGAVSIQPLMTERSVLRLSGERAEKKTAHWQAAAVAACEQCGRNRIPVVHSPVSYQKWLIAGVESAQAAIESIAFSTAAKAILCLHLETLRAADWAAQHPSQPLICLAGPEGGLSPQEQQAAIDAGFAPITLGTRTLRSETAPLAALAIWTLS
ncbi:16S rRNA (uracil(1498)-N(3))-methyltransferase [Variovorax sp. PCZ-1]|uniref:16S rRNA (uracil(1498)-N(3))-methyltransferase n=1 Tax=Variovorax sp. PCZ-1 TaxID=2835533 RepID=UPI001BCC8EAB|nr:16S rRNA (uracil(1498)-N(3))-methyltransferase [Variovorax sp. PCZ-1]MBS7806130.1 16S rRNA (uracil(1498)-N(3))-methyltransferase [Variovorax sp. PCZ-1]